MVNELLIATMESRIEHNQVSEIPNLELPVDRCLISLRCGANRHPLVINLTRHRNALIEVTLSLIMVLSAGLPGVIHKLMIIPDTNPWMRGMCRL